MDESGEGKSKIILLHTPGLSVFAQDPNNSPVRGQFTAGGNGGRTFAVIGAKFWEVLANGTLSNPVINAGSNAVANDNSPVTMCSGPSQVLLVSDGVAYVYFLTEVRESPISVSAATQVGANTTYAYTFPELDEAPLTVGQLVSVAGMANAGNDIVDLVITAVGVGTFTVVNAGGVTEVGSTGTGSSAYAAGTFLALGTGGVAGPDGIAMTPLMCAYLDGFFIILMQNSNQIQVSAPADASYWDPTQVENVSVFSDNVLSIKVDHRLLWMYGPKQTVVYYDAGGIFPLSVDPSGIIELGIAAPFSVAQANNTLCWLGMNDRGTAMVWSASGFSPVRISNHAIETALASYATVADAIGYGYQDQGHDFYVLYFPTANKTWVFDAATNMWHERDHWNPATAKSSAHLSQNHTFNFNTHLVGDWNSGTIYKMSINNLSDNGGVIRRIRRAPHISTEQQWIFHHYMQVDVEVGLGPIPPLLDGFGNARAPQMLLRWSNDGGKTWSKQLSRSCGQAGKYKTRVLWRRLGKSRDRIYEVEMTDPVPWRIADAYLSSTPGFEVPTESYPRSLSKLGL